MYMGRYDRRCAENYDDADDKYSDDEVEEDNVGDEVEGDDCDDETLERLTLLEEEGEGFCRSGFGGGFFSTKCRTRSRVAIESSTEECPTEPPPFWISLFRCCFAL
jgi:hypothetical protein